MHDRVARVAALTCAALDRRPRTDAALAASAALTADYGAHPTFADPTAPLPDDDRFAGLTDIFALGDGAATVLQVALAADLDANVALAFDLLSARVAVGWPSVGVALELAGLATA